MSSIFFFDLKSCCFKKQKLFLFCFLPQAFFLLNSKLKQLQGILFFCLLFEFKETYVWANFLKMQPHEGNTLATKKRQFKKEKKEANFLKQCCNVQKQEELVSLFFLGLSQNLLGKKGNTLALLASGNVFFFSFILLPAFK